jgi:hypothetical protein
LNFGFIITFLLQLQTYHNAITCNTLLQIVTGSFQQFVLNTFFYFFLCRCKHIDYIELKKQVVQSHTLVFCNDTLSRLTIIFQQTKYLCNHKDKVRFFWNTHNSWFAITHVK